MKAPQNSDVTLDAAGRLAWALAQCRANGLRVTHPLTCALREFAEASGPLSASTMLASERIQGVFNRVTLYRILARLESIGLVKRIGLNERSQHYCLPMPGEHHDYLVCLGCGHLEDAPMACPIKGLEDKINRKTGFVVQRHDLVFWGRCVNCAEPGTSVK